MNIMKYFSMLAMVIILQGCAVEQKPKPDEDQLGVSNVQREIRIGMSSAAVVEVLGSPNIITTDIERREVWVYDRVSTVSAQASSGGGLWLILGSLSKRESSSSTSQKNLTIIIKFDTDNLVRDYSYRQSSF